MMTREQLDALPEPQRDAFLKLWGRSGIPLNQLLQRSIPPTEMFPYIGIQDFHGMFVGIEPDGYTHS